MPQPSTQSPSLAVSRRAARPVRRALFASDMHLDGRRPEGVRRALALLARAREQRVDALFLLGDVFAAWLGPPSLHDPGLAPFLEGLAALTADDVRVVLVHGNHDFAAGAELTEVLGLEVAAEGLWVTLGGQRAWLTHGDAFCTRDLGYHRLHRVLRSRPVRWLLARLSRRGLEGLAGLVGAGAGKATAAKPRAVMDIVDGAVEARLARGADLVVCGHVHRARDGALAGGRLVVMADFETTGSHARWADGRLELVREDDELALPAGDVLAMDGPAGSGKSTVARLVAARLGWLRLDTGALYRAVTLAALEAGLDLADGPALEALAADLDLELGRDGGLRLDGEPLADERLRSPEVSAAVSPVSALPGVRAALLPLQRGARRGRPGVVAEGRDMASVVFPDALLAVYLDARPEVRARRRLAQNAGEGADLEAVLAAQAARDARDAGRELAPLRLTPGALRLDTSDLTLEQVVERLVAAVRERQAGRTGA